ncbi:glycosyltransferase family 2 protein [Pedobacter miscanthi]|uniref:Glycosyltransferase n=1 Tax=Pedobacter miscanthi TaxID=2259170 RepID=A0A366L898_9SPHI|nr:glycosyltransferase family 2 protein [Pedobacter miscanthi]RBQ10020.1 glycosyltransferase [Pedobacter miscanthi]
MKISLITVVYNGETFLQECFNSVIAQTYPDIEYLVIDGGSTDRTLGIINQNRSHIDYFISEKDKGLYDAINKGIRQATGEIIGILNADDMFANTDVLSQVASTFTANPTIDGLYGDLDYIHPTSHKVIRKWRAKQTTYLDLKKGWMPAHPTLYLKRELFDQYGAYALDLGTAADYELILRYFYIHKIKAEYLPMLMVNMRMGGVSNQSLKSRFHALVNDYKALKRNRVPNAFLVLFKKKTSKLGQF